MSYANCRLLLAGSLSFLGFAVAGTAHAQLPEYSWAEISYGTGDLELAGETVDLDGLEIEGSYRLTDSKLWVFGSWADLSGDFEGLDVDVETLTIGAGVVFESDTDGTFDVSLLRREDEVNGADVDGLGVAAGGRWMVIPSTEVFGRLAYLQGDYDGVLAWDLGIVFSLSETMAITGSYELLDGDLDAGGFSVPIEIDQIQIGARYKF